MSPQEQHAHAVMLAERRNRQPQNLRYAFLFDGPQTAARWAKRSPAVYVNMYIQNGVYTSGQPRQTPFDNRRDYGGRLAYRVRVKFKKQPAINCTAV